MTPEERLLRQEELRVQEEQLRAQSDDLGVVPIPRSPLAGLPPGVTPITPGVKLPPGVRALQPEERANPPATVGPPGSPASPGDLASLGEVLAAMGPAADGNYTATLALHQKTGQPISVLSKWTPEIRKRAQAVKDDPAAFWRESPDLARFLVKRPEVAPAVIEDQDNLSWVEKLMKGRVPAPLQYGILALPEALWGGKIEDVPRAVQDKFKAGQLQVELAKIARKQAEGTETLDDLIQADKLERRIEALNQGLPEIGLLPSLVAYPAEQFPRYWAQKYRMADWAAVGGLAATAIALAAPTMGASVAALAIAGGIGYGLQAGVFDVTAQEEGDLFYRDAIQAGVSRDVALANRQFVGTVNGAFESLSFGPVVRLVPGSGALLKKVNRDVIRRVIGKPAAQAVLARAALRMGESMAVEGGQEMAQEITSLYNLERAKGEDYLDSWAGVWEARQQVLEAGKAGALSGGGMSIPGVWLQARSEFSEARQALEREQTVLALGQKIGESGFFKALPDHAKAFVKTVQEENGLLNNVGVPVGKLKELLSAEGVTTEELQQKMPNVARMIEGAQSDEDEILVGLDDFATHVVGTQSFPTILSKDTRYGDRLTSREGAKLGKQIVSEWKAWQQEQEDAKKVEPSPRVKVFNHVYEQIKKMPKADPLAASNTAAIFAAHAVARASRQSRETGQQVDPFELYMQDPISFVEGTWEDLGRRGQRASDTLTQRKLRKVAPGFYTTPDEQYEIARNEAGEWYWNRAGKPPDDIYRTKAEALAALNAYLDADVLKQTDRPELTPKWISAVQVAVDKAKQKKGDAKSWLAIIQKDSKKEEQNVLGIKEWLAEQKGVIEKQAVLDYIDAHRQLLALTERVLETYQQVPLTQDQIDEHLAAFNRAGIKIEPPVGQYDSYTYEYSYEAEEELDIEYADDILSELERQGVPKRTLQKVDEIFATASGLYGDVLYDDNYDRLGIDWAAVDPDGVATRREKKTVARAKLAEINKKAAEEIKALIGDRGVQTRVDSDGELHMWLHTVSMQQHTSYSIEDIYWQFEREGRVAEVEDLRPRSDALTADVRSRNRTQANTGPYSSYTYMKGKLTLPKSYREILLYAPGEMDLDTPFGQPNTLHGHWGDSRYLPREGNAYKVVNKGLLGHIRFTEQNFNGETVLVIEEIQSDRNQDAAKFHRAARETRDNLLAKELDFSPEKWPERERHLREEAGYNDSEIEMEKRRWARLANSEQRTRAAELARVEHIIANKGFDSLAAVKTRLKVWEDPNTGDIWYYDPAFNAGPEKDDDDKIIGPPDRAYAFSAPRDTPEARAKASEHILKRLLDDNRVALYSPLSPYFEDIAIKRFLMWAAERGYKHLMWTPAVEQIRTRWGYLHLDKPADTISMENVGAKGWKLKALYQGSIVFDNDNRPIDLKMNSWEDVEDLLGVEDAAKLKEAWTAAVKAATDKGEAAPTTFSMGGAWKAGGAGFRKTYDRTIPSLVKKFLKTEPVLIEHPGVENEDDDWNMPVMGLDEALLREEIKARVERQLAWHREVLLPFPDQQAYAARRLALSDRLHGLQNDLQALISSTGKSTYDDDRPFEMRVLEVQLADTRTELDDLQGITDASELEYARNRARKKIPKLEGALNILAKAPLAKVSSQDLSFLEGAGVKVDDLFRPFATKGQVWQAEITEEARVRLKQGLTVLQRDQDNNVVRGFYQQKLNRITVTPDGNFSTFAHESGHAFLRLLMQDALTSPEAARDMEILNKWVGARDALSWNREQLEEFARGFERYLMEGKAPSTALARVFDTFRAFLIQIYTHFTKLNVDISDDVRGVMDRMLATDVEIAEAREKLGLLPPTPPEGMDEGLYERLKKTFETAIEEARRTADKRSMRESRRALENTYRQIKTEVTEAARARLGLNVREVIRTGRRLDGEAVPPLLLTDQGEGRKLDRAWVKQNMSLTPDQMRKLASVLAMGGLDPEVAAPAWSLKSGKDLIQALLNDPSSPSAWVKAETDRRMGERYPGFRHDQKWAAENAYRSLHTDAVGNAIWSFAVAMGKRLGADTSTSARVAIREAARLAADGMNVMELTVGRIQRNEARAAREAADAWKDKNERGAYEATLRQVFNHYLWRWVDDGVAEAQEIVDYLRSFSDVSKQERLARGSDVHLLAIQKILSEVELGPAAKSDLNLALALQGMLARGEPVVLPADYEKLLQNYRLLSLNQLRDLRDLVKNLEHQASEASKIYLRGRSEQFNAKVRELVDVVNGNAGKPPPPPGPGRPLPPGNRRWYQYPDLWLTGVDSVLSKMEFFFRRLDGGVIAGPLQLNLFQPFVDAESEEQLLLVPLLERIRKQHGKVGSDGDTWVDFLTHRYKLRDILMLAGNVRNEGNFQRLLASTGWQRELVLARLDEIFTEHPQMLSLLNELGNTVESFWPQIKAVYQKFHGVAPRKVSGQDITLPSGKVIKGGYWPIIRDYDKAGGKPPGVDDFWDESYLPIAPEHGFTESRSARATTPLKFNLDDLTHHLIKVVHYVTHYEAVRNVDRVLADPRMKAAILASEGSAAMYRQIKPWLEQIARGPDSGAEAYGTINRFLQWGRIGSSFTLMGGKIAFAAKQSLGLFTSGKELGLMADGSFQNRKAVKYLAYGLTKVVEDLAHARSPSKQIQQLDPAFVLFHENYDRDLRLAYRKVLSSMGRAQALHADALKMSMLMFRWVQGTVNAATWYGAFKKAQDEDHSDPTAYATALTRQSQSSGAPKDLARIQTGPEFVKIWTVMYTWWNTMYQQYRALQNTRAPTTAATIWSQGSQFMWLVLLPVATSMLIAGKLFDDDEEPEDKVKHFTKEVALFMSRSVPVLDRLVDKGLNNRQLKYAPWVDALFNVAGIGGAYWREDSPSERQWEQFWKDSGMYLHLPTGAAMNAIEFLELYNDGALEEPFRDLLLRSPSEYK